MAHVLSSNSRVKVVHCMIHREVLISKALPETLAMTINEVIKVVNYIKSCPLRSRIFTNLCEAMDLDHICLLYHTKDRWLSKGKVLPCVISLRPEITSFFDTEKINFEFINDLIWWLEVTFLSDLFHKLNALNLSIQGVNESIITISGKLKAFKDKL